MVGNAGLLVNVDIARQKSFKTVSKPTKQLFIIYFLYFSALLTHFHPYNIEEWECPGGQVPPRKKHTGKKISFKTTKPLKRSCKT